LQTVFTHNCLINTINFKKINKMSNQKFQLSEIPYAQFAQLGMDKQAVQKALNMDDIERLLNGEKTNLKKFDLNTVTYERDEANGIKGGNAETTAKFFLRRMGDNSVELRVIEQTEQINNRFNVSVGALAKLQKGETVIEKDAKNSQNYIYQLDKETNSVMRMNQSKFNVPDAIQDIQLSQNQKEALRNGQHIELKKDGNTVAVKIDFNQKNLLSFQKAESISTANKQDNTVTHKRPRGMKL
jgi:Protein of unknown function (DUF3945)/Protein of unknown function (DUF4099)